MNLPQIQDDAPYVIAVHLRALLDYVHAQGQPTDGVLAACGLGEQDLNHADGRVPDVAIDRAFIAAEQVCRDPSIGLHAGCSVRPTHYGMLGHLMLTCGNLVEMMDLHMRYAQLVGDGMSAQYRMEGTSMCLDVQLHPARPPYHRHTNEFHVAGWISMARWLAGSTLSPDRIEFPHEAPAELGEQQAFFGCELGFNAPRLRIFFKPSLLQVPFLHGNSDLHRTMEAEAHKRLLALRSAQSGRDKLLNRICQHIAERLPHGVPDMQSVASALDFSVRSLQRQLDSRNTGYKELVEQLRQELAQRYANDPSLSLVDIALMLGFSEQSTFQRAFRRWFRMTPGEFRRGLSTPD